MTKIYQKSDMNYKYNDNNDWDDKTERDIDRIFLSRTESYEVWYLINELAKKWNLTKKQCIKLEEIIHEQVPQELKNRDDIINWIEKNKITYLDFWRFL